MAAMVLPASHTALACCHRPHAVIVGCPPGSRYVSPGWCELDPCTSGRALRRDDRTYRCRPLRVCTETRETQTLGPFLLSVMVERTSMVVATCEVDEGCDGTEDRAHTAGRYVRGSRSCADMRVWVADPLPSLSTREPPPGDRPAAERVD